MTNSENGTRHDEGVEQKTETAGAADDTATPGWGEGAAAADAERLAALEADNAELKDRVLRAAADMENLRRRTEREIRDARQFAVAGFARDMLGVSDNLSRALQAIPAEVRDGADSGFKSLVEGVEMTARSMLSALESHGVRKLEPKGQRFDPNFHQAMFEVPNAEIPANTVVEVVQDGYAIGERVLRPALVGVSKGGPKAPVEPASAGADEATRDA
ncbi:molecular chaperone GrpE [Aureimonas altamirensis DSM 21988]|jgi:molecular chaperone GrpE|uniref:Protein GrpE n=1 Tax=Aureimonas altamirensis DSM 21988 TaxID=1121026 RepID=A0ABY1IP22_9HYPH|nr:nucleotide exchange factor GrpE [Aureimonas altamirensis]SHJ72727.1 molecular chaperone GrpE [Aureimonas altamirensis DSM 21988]